MSKILLAEDDRTMVTLLTTLLKMEGFEVVVVDVQSDVPSVVANEHPDHLLMDVHLAGQSGVDILKKIRKNTVNKNLNIVMASGLNARDECLKHGANYFLMKPFMADDLLKLLKK